jgi:transcriptional regulator with PAS, ATPase and Fis domain
MSKKANITVIGFPKILTSCQEVAEEYLNSANFLYYQYLPEVRGVRYIASSPDHPIQDSKKSFNQVSHDIIIVGVVTAKALEGVNKNSIIPFRVGNKAVLNALLKAKKIADKAAFICPIEEKHDVHFYEKLVGLKIDIYYADQLADYRRFCKDAKQCGHSVVISGSYTFQIAKEYGLIPVFLFSDHDIFHDAYSRALETHRYNQSLEEKVAQLEIISQNIEDSVVFVDNMGGITFTNKVAEQKLLIRPDTIRNKPVSQVFGFISPELLTQKGNSEILGTIGKEPILVTIHPVFVGPDRVGSVLIAKKVNEIRAMDSRIRQKMRYKGFTAKYTFRDILGDSQVLKECKKHAKLYSASEAPVLIYGATGTGKELFAQAIHNASPRKLFPFVAINCATLPSELMESELFGYVKGAFTGASSQGKQGLVDQAHLGTLFFDEVDSLSPSLQPKLLRLLQEKEFIRVGGDEIIPVDIRIIAACNKKQSEDPEKNLLRQDLFYRLSTLYLQLPQLLERKTDIPLLFNHFLAQYDRDLAECIDPLPQSVVALLSAFTFKGNLRELQSIAARFSCLCNKDQVRNQGYLGELLRSCCHMNVAQPEDSVPNLELPVQLDSSFADAMKHAEKSILRLSKKRSGGSVQKMAKQLRLGRTTLWRKLKEHELD